MTDTQRTKEAEQAWIDKADQTSGYSISYMQGLMNFKSTLIQALEKRVEECRMYESHTKHHSYRIQIEQLKEVIKTVKELKP